MEKPATTLADRLESARTAAGLTQEEVASAVGMAQPSYSALERGNSKTTSKIGSFAHLFGVDAYWLETGQGEMRPANTGVREDRKAYYPEPPPIDQARTPEERKLLRLFRTLTDKQRRGLLALLGKGEA